MNEEHEGGPVEGKSDQPTIGDMIELLCAEVVLDQRLLQANPGPETPEVIRKVIQDTMVQGARRRERIKAQINERFGDAVNEPVETSDLEKLLGQVEMRMPRAMPIIRAGMSRLSLSEDGKVKLLFRFLQQGPAMKLDVAGTLNELAEQVLTEEGESDGQ